MNYKCVKSWQRHSVGTVINEWEYVKLPINIKSGHFQEIKVPDSTTNQKVPLPESNTLPLQTFTSNPSANTYQSLKNKYTKDTIKDVVNDSTSDVKFEDSTNTTSTED